MLVKSGTVLCYEFSNGGLTPAGGASTADLRTLSQHNVSMDIATFKKLQVDALVVSRGGNSLGQGELETGTTESPGFLRRRTWELVGVLTWDKAFCQVEPHEGLV